MAAPRGPAAPSPRARAGYQGSHPSITPRRASPKTGTYRATPQHPDPWLQPPPPAGKAAVSSGSRDRLHLAPQHTPSNSSCPWEEQPADLILRRADGCLQGRLPGAQRIPGDGEAGSGMRLCCWFPPAPPPRGGEQVLAACFLLPPGDLLLTGKHPQVPCSSPGRKRCPNAVSCFGPSLRF